MGGVVKNDAHDGILQTPCLLVFVPQDKRSEGKDLWVDSYFDGATYILFPWNIWNHYIPPTCCYLFLKTYKIPAKQEL